MSAILPNPLQELAEKLRLSRGIAGWDQGSQYESMLIELLTDSVGTLLQAERVAQLSQLAAFFDHRGTEFRRKEEAFGGTNSIVRANECETTARYLRNLATPEAASALSAVVQRETAKLKALLKEIAMMRHIDGDHSPLTVGPFSSCPEELCAKVNAALQ